VYDQHRALRKLRNQPEVLISHAMDRFDQQGNLTDAPTRERITGLLQNLVDWARRIGPK